MKIKRFEFQHPQLVIPFKRKDKKKINRDTAYPYVTAIAIAAVIILYAIVEVDG